MIVYKLTGREYHTAKTTLWGVGVRHTASGIGPLCTAGWIHAYEHPLLAVLHDPIGGRFGSDAVLWEAEAEEPIQKDHQLKLGAAAVTTLRRMEKPVVTKEQQVTYGILCALSVYHAPAFVSWARGRLDGTDRRARAAAAAAEAAAAAS